MHKMILENEGKIKSIMREKFEDALEYEDLETICEVMKMECIMQDLKEDMHKMHTMHFNPGHSVGTAEVKTTNPGPHGHGYGTVSFTTIPKE